MRIYTRIVVDMASGRVEEAEYFEHLGPVARCGLFGGGDSTTIQTTNIPGPTPEELGLVKLNMQLAQRQLANIDQLAPFQQELLSSAMGELTAQREHRERVLAAFTPEEQATMARDEAAAQRESIGLMREDAERARRLGPIQDELLNLQLDQLRRGGAATPEQAARIKAAADAAVIAGGADIDLATQRGIGLIADELANSRGLRLSDSPIAAEAALLAREGLGQKAALSKNIRAAEAASSLNFPLAAAQITSGIAGGQQQLAEATRQFQAELRQRAFQNRLALTGQATSGGIGLASIGIGSGALDALTRQRLAGATTTSSTEKGVGLGEIGQLAGGIGGLFSSGIFSDHRLKRDYGAVARTETGIPLHLFRYKGDPELRLGVMADEAEKIAPEAVGRHRSGYKFVDYASPGIGLIAA